MASNSELRGEWLSRAMFFELLAKSFSYPTKELAHAIVEGDYAAAVRESCSMVGLAGGVDLARAIEGAYSCADAAGLERELRVEHTRLFIGTTEPVVSPYGSYWIALAEGREPVLFLSRETQEVEAIMHAAGVGNKSGLKEPLDNIVCELEFLQYAYTVLCGSEPLSDGAVLDETDVASFAACHVRRWVGDFASAVDRETQCVFYRTAASLLLGL